MPFCFFIAVASTASVESSKIDIHVHVTVNTGGGGGPGDGAPPAYPPPAYSASYSHGPLQGTLADLKKQRALSRPALTGTIALNALPLDERASGSVAPPQAAESPPLPRRRFVTGDAALVTSEVPREKTGCCCWLQ